MSEENHVNRTKLFTVIFVLLVILTGLSFAVANSSLMDHPLRGWLAMILISVAKASLVIVFFMHLAWETNWKYVLTIPAGVMSTLLVLILIPDIGNRTEAYSAEREKFAAFELPKVEAAEIKSTVSDEAGVPPVTSDPQKMPQDEEAAR